MSSQSDGSGRPDDIIIIKQLLQKLEEAAHRSAEAQREADAPIAIEQVSALELTPDNDAVVSVAAQDEPLLALSTLKMGASATTLPAPHSADAQHGAIAIDMRSNETALVTTEAPMPVRRGPGIAVALSSFVLGVIVAGAVVVAFDPLKHLAGYGLIAKAPVSATERPVGADSAKGKEAAALSLPIAASTMSGSGAQAEALSTQANSGSAASESSASSAAAIAKADPLNEEPKPSEPGGDSPAADTGRQAAAAPAPASPAPAPAVSAVMPERPTLHAPARVEVRAGAQAAFDLQVQASAEDMPKLLVILREMPPWLSLSKGGSIGNNIWLIPALQLRGIELSAADGAIGSAELKVQLANIDGTIVSETALNVLTVAAVAPLSAPADAGLSANTEAMMLKLQAQGQLLLDTGEIEAARTLLRTAAEAGSVVAALRLAETYDPAEMRRLGMAERTADVGQAVRWYEHAQALGSPVATARLIALGRQ